MPRYGYLRENPPPPGFTIIPIYPDTDPTAELAAVDPASLQRMSGPDDVSFNLAYSGRDLFERARIRPARHEAPALLGVIPSPTGYRAIGVIFGGDRGPDHTADVNIEFSAAVHPDYRRTGIWRMLATRFVQDMEAVYGGEPGLSAKLEAYVINPATIPVLEELGFVNTANPGEPRSPWYWKRL